MALNIQLPQTGSSSVKDAIVSILSSEWPLTQKQLFNKIKANGRSVTYQAVHKAITEMMSAGVVSKEGTSYSINQDYIKQVKDFGTKLESIYEKKGNTILETLEKNGSITLEFEKQIEMGRFIIDLVSDTHEKSDKIYMMLRFVWCPLTLSEKEYNQMRNLLSETEMFILTPESRSNPMERKFSQLWEQLGAKVIFESGLKSTFEYVVYNEFVVQVLFPHDMYEYRNSERKQSLEEVDLNIYYDRILREKAKVFVTIIKNREMAEECRKHIELEMKKK